MSIADYAELKILEHLTGRTAWTAPASVHLQLHTADPTDTGTVGYAASTVRRPVTFSAAASGAIVSNATVEWNPVPAAATYSHWTLWDNATVGSGNCLWTGALTTPATVALNDIFQITSLTLSLD